MLQIDASLVYYITPIGKYAIGYYYIWREKTLLEYIAIIVAIIGIIYKTVNISMFPTLSISIALSFGIYRM